MQFLYWPLGANRRQKLVDLTYSTLSLWSRHLNHVCTFGGFWIWFSFLNCNYLTYIMTWWIAPILLILMELASADNLVDPSLFCMWSLLAAQKPREAKESCTKTFIACCLYCRWLKSKSHSHYNILLLWYFSSLLISPYLMKAFFFIPSQLLLMRGAKQQQQQSSCNYG